MKNKLVLWHILFFMLIFSPARADVYLQGMGGSNIEITAGELGLPNLQAGKELFLKPFYGSSEKLVSFFELSSDKMNFTLPAKLETGRYRLWFKTANNEEICLSSSLYIRPILIDVPERAELQPGKKLTITGQFFGFKDLTGWFSWLENKSVITRKCILEKTVMNAKTGKSSVVINIPDGLPSDKTIKFHLKREEEESFVFYKNAEKIKNVLIASGGSIDDYFVFAMMHKSPKTKVLGVVMTNTDCIALPAMSTQWKMAEFLNSTSTSVALNHRIGWNPFPWIYRSDGIDMGNLPLLKDLPANKFWPPFPSSSIMMEKILLEAARNYQPVTLLAPCPLTFLKDLMLNQPKLNQSITEMVFMGGAVDVPGNLDPKTLPKGYWNGKAEWNIFYDPQAVELVFENSCFPIYMFPLDITNQAKVSPDFLGRLKKQGMSSSLSKLAADSYSLVARDSFYRLWNSVAAAWLIAPQLYEQPQKTNLKVIVQGMEQGAMVKDKHATAIYVFFNLKDRTGLDFNDFFIDFMKD